LQGGRSDGGAKTRLLRTCSRPEDASSDDIKRAYRLLAKKYQPRPQPGKRRGGRNEVQGSVGSIRDAGRRKETRTSTTGTDHRPSTRRSAGRASPGRISPTTPTSRTYSAGSTSSAGATRSHIRPPRRKPSNAPAPGERPCATNLEITLEQAAGGPWSAKSRSPTAAACGECGRDGAREGTAPKKCPRCGGAGQVQNVAPRGLQPVHHHLRLHHVRRVAARR